MAWTHLVLGLLGCLHGWSVPSVVGRYDRAWVAQSRDTIRAVGMVGTRCQVRLAGVWDGAQFQVVLTGSNGQGMVRGTLRAGLDDTLELFVGDWRSVCTEAPKFQRWGFREWITPGQFAMLADSSWAGRPEDGLLVLATPYDPPRGEKIYRVDRAIFDTQVVAVRRLSDSSFSASPTVKPRMERTYRIPDSSRHRGWKISESVPLADSTGKGWALLQHKQWRSGRQDSLPLVVVSPEGWAQMIFRSRVGSAEPKGWLPVELQEGNFCDAVQRAMQAWLDQVQRQVDSGIAIVHPRITRERLVFRPVRPQPALDVDGIHVCAHDLAFPWRTETDSGKENVRLATVATRDGSSGWRAWLPEGEFWKRLDSSIHQQTRGVPDLYELSFQVNVWRLGGLPKHYFSDRANWNYSVEKGVTKICWNPTPEGKEPCIEVEYGGGVRGPDWMAKLPGWTNCYGVRCEKPDTLRIGWYLDKLLKGLVDGMDIEVPRKDALSFLSKSKTKALFGNDLSLVFFRTYKNASGQLVGEICLEAGKNQGCFRSGPKGLGWSADGMFAKLKKEDLE